jgi:CheY-like chemotaxis protein
LTIFIYYVIIACRDLQCADQGITTETKRKNMKILVVDDDESCLDSLVCLLRAVYPDWEIVPASGGPEAIGLIRSQSSSDIFDIVITDCDMPEANGFDVCREAKGLRFDVITIMVSGRMSDGDLRDEAICAGVTHCLAKPFMLEELRKVLPKETAVPA